MKTSFTKSSLKKISKKLRHSETLTDEDEVIFSEYRKVHKYILNNFQSKIRKRIKGNKKYRYVLFAQRLKRRKTIINKIRNRFSEMDLSRMHDIAGGRIIFPNIELLKKFRKEFLNSQKKSKKYTHVSGDKYDYITNPNIKTGYRGIHDIFREITQDSIKTEIEIQYRTEVQHAWATACEIWDSNFDDQTKFGMSNKKIQLFFRLISELFSRLIDGAESSYLGEIILYIRILKMESELKVLSRLKGINVIKTLCHYLPQNKKTNRQILLLTKYVKEEDVNFVFYQKFDDAMSEYVAKELEKRQADSVLVMVEDSKELRKAYNNYFNDVSAFFLFWDEVTQKIRKKHSITVCIIEQIFPTLRKLSNTDKKIIEDSLKENIKNNGYNSSIK